MADQREPVGEDVVEAMADYLRSALGRIGFMDPEWGGTPDDCRMIARELTPFVTAAERRGEERMRARIADWLHADADLTETESRKIISDSHGLTLRDVADWQGLVATKRGIATAIRSLNTSGGA